MKAEEEQMLEETVPTFLVQGDKITEVVYTKWAPGVDGVWGMKEGIENITVPGECDGVVFETPAGCLRADLVPMRRGDGLSLVPGDAGTGAPLRACRGLDGWVEEKQVEPARSGFLRGLKRLVGVRA